MKGATRMRHTESGTSTAAAIAFCAVAWFLLLPPPGASQHTTVITFDETHLQQKSADGAGIRYANQGVIFQHAPHIVDLPL